MVIRYIYHWISELPQGKDEKQQTQGLDQEKFSNILKYLEESETKSATTETSDSGMRESCSISSELETDESIGKFKLVQYSIYTSSWALRTVAWNRAYSRL